MPPEPWTARFPDLVIRRAVPSDAAALARLRCELRVSLRAAAEAEPAFVDRCTVWMRPRLGSESVWRCWVVEREGVIRGNVWVQIIEKLPNPVGEPERHGYISNLYVQPILRGSGVGSALLERCLRECEAHSVDAVVLWPTPKSRSLYQRHGFAVREDVMVLKR
ncbi:MAG TPA: GNAT family N-acetyltransferase [Vicinamibacterales bacterium]|jgi:ribosomal protein S18 acetylase RimI-like enzyme|nr:GNAT family N-acetyltransferase [Vicinamibacterales bacterium]